MSKELQEKRNQLAAQIRKLGDEFDAGGKKWASDEKRAEWDKVNADYDQTVRELVASRAAKDVEDRLNALRDDDERSTIDRRDIPGREDTDTRREQRKLSPEQRYEREQEQRTLALAGWCRYQMGGNLSRRHVQACRAVGLRPSQRQLVLRLPDTRRCEDLRKAFRQHHPSLAAERIQESRALSAFQAAAGGVLVPDTLLRTLEVNMLAYGGMRQVAETITTAHGEDLTWPTADDTSNTGAQLGESTSIGSSVDPSFGGVVWGAYKFSSKPILVPYELIEDQEFGLPALLGQMQGERLGRITNTKYTTGTGAATPKGIMTAASSGVTAASTSAISADEVIQLVHSVDPAYRNGAGFMMHDSIVLKLRLLKDGDGQYLWQNGMREGAPDRLLGYQITVNQDMASSIASAARTILFGQLSKYKIRRVNSIRMYRLEERYRDTDQDGFVAFVREDGNLLTAGTAPVKYLVH